MLSAEYVGTSELQPSSAEMQIEVSPIPVKFSLSFQSTDGNTIQLVQADSDAEVHLRLSDPEENSIPDGIAVRFTVSQGAFHDGENEITAASLDGEAVVQYSALSATGTTILKAVIENSIYSGRYSKTFMIGGECVEDCPSEIVPEFTSSLVFLVAALHARKWQARL